MKTHEPMEVTASRRQTRATCREGSGATAPREAQQRIANHRSRLGFHFARHRGLLLAKSAGTKASGGTFAASASAVSNEFSRCRHPQRWENKFHYNAMSSYLKPNGCNQKGRPAKSTRLFHITLQHDQKLLQLFSAFGWRVGVFDAVLHVRMNQSFRQRLDGLSCRHQLHQYLGTVAVFFQHPFNRVQLANDAAHPNFLGITFAAGMTVLFHASEQ